MVQTETAEPQKKRKKVTTKRIPREHAGKVSEPYAIMERLIPEVDHFEPLSKAKFVMLWKWGWRPDVDGILIRAKIKKASDLDKELGEEFDYAILLNAELWKGTKISAELKELDVFHELCHAASEMDRDGEQRKDDRGRLCWRLRKHPITEFPECLKRYGLKKITGLAAEAIAALDDAKLRQEAKDDKIAERPIIQQAEKSGEMLDAKVKDWRRQPINEIGLRATDAAKLAEAGISTAGELQDLMTKEGTWWTKGVHGVGDASKDRIEDVFSRLVMDAEFGTDGK